MGKNTTTIIYILVMVATVVIVDVVFFRRHVWGRLIVNIGIVLVYIACYLAFFGNR